VHAPLGRIENYTSVENRNYGLGASGHALIPQFELATILRSPVLVEIDQHIDAPLQIHRLVMIEVSMHRQVTALMDAVEACAGKIWIRDESFYSGNVFNDADEWARVERVEDLSCGRREDVWVETFLLSLLVSVEFLFGDVGPGRKIPDTNLKHVGRQEFLYHYVRERVCTLKALAKFAALVAVDVAGNQPAILIHFMQIDHDIPQGEPGGPVFRPDESTWPAMRGTIGEGST
jgi:hypothetical protein